MRTPNLELPRAMMYDDEAAVLESRLFQTATFQRVQRAKTWHGNCSLHMEDPLRRRGLAMQLSINAVSTGSFVASLTSEARESTTAALIRVPKMCTRTAIPHQYSALQVCETRTSGSVEGNFLRMKKNIYKLTLLILRADGKIKLKEKIDGIGLS